MKKKLTIISKEVAKTLDKTEENSNTKEKSSK